MILTPVTATATLVRRLNGNAGIAPGAYRHGFTALRRVGTGTRREVPSGPMRTPMRTERRTRCRTSSRDSKASSPSRRKSPSRTRRAVRSGTAASTSRNSSATSPTGTSGACWWTTRSRPGCRRPSRTRSRCTPATSGSTCRAPWPCSRPAWGLRQLLDISDEQAREDLARASVMALSFVAQSARGVGLPMVPQRLVDQAGDDHRAVHDPLARRARPAARARRSTRTGRRRPSTA